MTDREQIARLKGALESIIKWNRDHARDQYGDAEKAESWACIKEARAALAGTPSTDPEFPKYQQLLTNSLEALENLANVFHEGRAGALQATSEGYVGGAVDAAEANIEAIRAALTKAQQ